jgi:3-oxoacyl-[acyl-carrier protein] reductase
MQERPTALVTAAAGAGIGAAIASRLAADGFDVIVSDIHERRCGELADKLSAEHGRGFTHHLLDVTDETQVESVVAKIAETKGRLDVLVNNAGWSKIEPVAEMSSETWKRCLDVDLTGTFHTMRYALPLMQQNNSGAIVNISSISAYETSTEHGAAYSAAKAGVLALTRVAAAENGKFGIRVNAVTPGLIYNDFLRKIYPDEFFSGYAENRSLLGRVGRPEDVAGLVSFLVGPDSGYVTGEVYGISGGVHPHG